MHEPFSRNIVVHFVLKYNKVSWISSEVNSTLYVIYRIAHSYVEQTLWKNDKQSKIFFEPL